jgi:diacylglycerol kinase (CTP)
MVKYISRQSTLMQRSDLHIARKIWHMGTVFLMFLVWISVPTQVSYFILAIAWLAFVPIDVVRQKSQGLNQWLMYAFRPIMRESEINKLAGTTYLLSGVMVIVCFFPKVIVSLSLLFLAFADPIASYIGIKFGKDKLFGHKSLQGTLAAYAVCTILSLFFVLQMGHSLDRAIVFSILAGCVGALSELLPLGKLDDNFTLPIFSALGLSFLFYFFGFFFPGV